MMHLLCSIVNTGRRFSSAAASQQLTTVTFNAACHDGVSNCLLACAMHADRFWSKEDAAQLESDLNVTAMMSHL